MTNFNNGRSAVEFTREPIIETIITPKEGYKLVVRSSKSTGQEEYFVDAVEIAAFGQALFFRSLERPKAFLVPVSDYEVLEVREARMVLKNAVLDRSIKIGGGRETATKPVRETDQEEARADAVEKGAALPEITPLVPDSLTEGRADKKRDRRRHYRKRKGRDETLKIDESEATLSSAESDSLTAALPGDDMDLSTESADAPVAPPLLSTLLQPPPTLISETINRYRQNELFRGAFYLKEEEQYQPHDKVQELLNEEEEDAVTPSLREPTFASAESVEPLEAGGLELNEAPPQDPLMEAPASEPGTEPT